MFICPRQTNHNHVFCQSAYTYARSTFEAILYSSMLAWLFLSVCFLPRNEAHEQRQQGRCCSFLVPCLRAMTFCIGPCRPLLASDEAQVARTVKRVGTCGTMAFMAAFLTLQLVPLVALVVGLTKFYPTCPCPDEAYNCKCTLSINGIPVGSCTVEPSFFRS